MGKVLSRLVFALPLNRITSSFHDILRVAPDLNLNPKTNLLYSHSLIYLVRLSLLPTLSTCISSMRSSGEGVISSFIPLSELLQGFTHCSSTVLTLQPQTPSLDQSVYMLLVFSIPNRVILSEKLCILLSDGCSCSLGSVLPQFQPGILGSNRRF